MKSAHGINSWNSLEHKRTSADIRPWLNWSLMTCTASTHFGHRRPKFAVKHNAIFSLNDVVVCGRRHEGSP